MRLTRGQKQTLDDLTREDGLLLYMDRSGRLYDLAAPRMDCVPVRVVLHPQPKLTRTMKTDPQI